MASLVLSGDTSGSITVAAPAVAGSNTQTLVATTGTLAPIVSGTSQASTSGTSIDFTSIPSWVKRITVMCSGVSLSASADLMFQIGSGSVTTSGYSSTWGYIYTASSAAVNTTTSGIIRAASLTSSTAWTGSVTLTLLTGNTWTATAVLGSTDKIITYATGVLALGGTLDRVRVTSSSGTDTFDAGSINILYE